MLRVSTDLGDKQFSAHTYNISVGGAFVQTGQLVFPKGSVVPLEFKIPADCQGAITAVGEVVRIVRKTGYHGNIPGFALRWITVHVKGHPETMDPLLIRYFGGLEGLPLDDVYKMSRDAAKVVATATQDEEEAEEEDQTAKWQRIRNQALAKRQETQTADSPEDKGLVVPDTIAEAKDALDLVNRGLPLTVPVTYRIQSVSYVGELKMISPTEVYIESKSGPLPKAGTRLRVPIRVPMGNTELRATLLCTVEEVASKKGEQLPLFRASVFNLEEEGSPGVLEAYLTHEARMLLKKDA
jgi:hypothetical protein